jgi:hypothetical protein
MNGNGKDGLADILAAMAAELNSSAQPQGPRIKFSAAANEIAEALKIHYEAAAMTLYGLCATGYVRWVDVSGEIVEEDELTVANFSNKPAFVVPDDVRSYLANWSPDPQPKMREQVIQALLAEGHNPPRKIKWKPFCDLVRDKCNGWLAPGKPALSFSDKQIQRAVKDLRTK